MGSVYDQLKPEDNGSDISRRLVKHDENYAFYEKNKEELARNYPGQFVAIVNDQNYGGPRVVGNGTDEIVLLQEVRRGFPNTPIYLDNPSEPMKVFNLPTRQTP